MKERKEGVPNVQRPDHHGMPGTDQIDAEIYAKARCRRRKGLLLLTDPAYFIGDKVFSSTRGTA